MRRIPISPGPELREPAATGQLSVEEVRKLVVRAMQIRAEMRQRRVRRTNPNGLNPYIPMRGVA